jgi:hypothetical protein
MNEDIELMVRIYGTYKVDWMGDEIKIPSDLTRHHIVKRENGGENGISNYALLTFSSHHLIHYLEDNYFEYYERLNELFLELNRTCAPPTIEYYEEVNKIMKKVRKSIKNSKRIRRIKRK